MKTLTVRTLEGKTLAVLTWENGTVNVVEATSKMGPAVRRWIDFGLDELIVNGAEVVSRSTPATSPEFLSRLRDYIRRQFDFTANLEEEPLRLEIRFVSGSALQQVRGPGAVQFVIGHGDPAAGPTASTCNVARATAFHSSFRSTGAVQPPQRVAPEVA
jgi:hypothetical protein